MNASDYLATTEAVGVRIAIHDKDEYPFPVIFHFSMKVAELKEEKIT